MPFTRQQKKDRNISDLETYAMASEDLIDVKLQAFETCMENKLRALFLEFRLGQSLNPTRSQQGESPDRKGNPPREEEHAMDPTSTHKVDFPRWEDGDPTGWLSRAELYFHYDRTPEASMVEITTIHLEGDIIQWYNWIECTQGVPTWRQFKSSLLIRFGPSEYENIDGQLTKIRQTSTIQEYQTRSKQRPVHKEPCPKSEDRKQFDKSSNYKICAEPYYPTIRQEGQRNQAKFGRKKQATASSSWKENEKDQTKAHNPRGSDRRKGWDQIDERYRVFGVDVDLEVGALERLDEDLHLGRFPNRTEAASNAKGPKDRVGRGIIEEDRLGKSYSR
ncbi:hypothetical protein BHE74_00017529 [Ensete ventricosum]|nr:hypothetical protein BHE74_00017529 [Ensete ventricosum]